MQHRANLQMLNKYKLYHSNLAMFGVVTHYTDRNHLNLIQNVEMGKVIIVNQSECKCKFQCFPLVKRHGFDLKTIVKFTADIKSPLKCY